MKLKTTLLVSLLALSGAAFAQTAAPAAPTPDYTLSFNVGAVTEYRYRGISQTRKKPALQGGIDFAHSSGFYLGTWASTIKWIKDGGGDSNVEIDVYGGYKTEVTAGVTLDVGVLTYNYPSNKLNPSANTQELYAALTYGPVTAKYSHSVSNLFGFADSKQSGYFEIAGTFDLGEGFTLTPHVGHQKVKNLSAASYTDYSVTINKDYAGLTFGLTLVDTNTDAYVGANGKDLGKSGVVLSVKKTF